jgi:hypothetical protein
LALADIAGVTPKLSVADPRVVVGELVHDDGRRFIGFIRRLDSALACELRVRCSRLRQLDAERSPVRKRLALAPFAVQVLELEMPAQ